MGLKDLLNNNTITLTGDPNNPNPTFAHNLYSGGSKSILFVNLTSLTLPHE